MPQRTRYLLAYDIREPKRLRRVHKVASDFGEPLQYSVFICDLTEIELLDLQAALRNQMNLSEDSVGIFDLGPPQTRGVACVTFLGARRRLPADEPRVW